MAGKRKKVQTNNNTNARIINFNKKICT
jgi:hypothetical protein